MINKEGDFKTILDKYEVASSDSVKKVGHHALTIFGLGSGYGHSPFVIFTKGHRKDLVFLSTKLPNLRAMFNSNPYLKCIQNFLFDSRFKSGSCRSKAYYGNGLLRCDTPEFIYGKYRYTVPEAISAFGNV